MLGKADGDLRVEDHSLYWYKRTNTDRYMAGLRVPAANLLMLPSHALHNFKLLVYGALRCWCMGP